MSKWQDLLDDFDMTVPVARSVSFIGDGQPGMAARQAADPGGEIVDFPMENFGRRFLRVVAPSSYDVERSTLWLPGVVAKSPFEAYHRRQEMMAFDQASLG